MAERIASLTRADRIELAVADCSKQDGISARKAAKIYNVAPSTITRRMNHSVQPATSVHQSRQRLSPTEEQMLVRKAIQHYDSGLPLGIRHLHEFAKEILSTKDAEVPEIGQNWHRKLLARNPSIKRVLSRPPSNRARAARVMRKATLDEFYELYKDMRKTHGVAFPDIYNMDEKGFVMGMNQHSRLLTPIQKKHANLNKDGGHEASVLECICADGEALPAWMIFQGVSQPNSGFQYLHNGSSSIVTSEKGWTDNEIALHWLQEHFHPLTEKRRHGEFRMLIIDGHESQCTPEFVEFCVKNKIILLILPPRNIHLVQPLELAVFQPLVKAYSILLDDHKRFCRTWLNSEDLIRYYQVARKEAVSPSNIISGWKRTGLFPFNPGEVFQQLSNPSPEDCQTQGVSGGPSEDQL